MKVYPGAGIASLRDPVRGDRVPAEGRDVEDSMYWRRRLRCGDATLSPPEQPAEVLPDTPEIIPALVAGQLDQKSAADPVSDHQGDPSEPVPETEGAE